MKRLFLSLFVIALSAAARAQVASWLIPPTYDNMYKVIGADLIVTDSIKEKTLWTFDGRRVFKTSEALFPFQDDVAVITKGSTTAILGFVTNKGELTPLDGYLVVNAYPYFSGGLLAVKSSKDGYCHYIDKRARVVISNCASAYPFMNGYAKCEAYENAQKKKGFNHLLLNSKGKPVTFMLNGKKVDNDNVNFTSSVNDEGLAVVVINQKVYLFNGVTQDLQPFYASDTEKVQAEVEGTLADFLQKKDDMKSELHAKCGNSQVAFRFDRILVPYEVVVGDEVKTYDKKEPKAWNTESPLEAVEKNGRYGLYWDGQELLPPQFTKVPTCFDNKAFACVAGRYGLLQVLKDEKFSFSMNKGNDIAFRHQRVETVVRVDLPPSVSAQSATIEMDPELGCEIDVTSRDAKTTSFGSSVQYGCWLTIPEELDDETQEVDYVARVVYDGLISTSIPFTVKEWYYKYFNIDVDDVETVIDKRNLLFTFNISADKQPGEEDYPSTVSVKAGKLPVSLEKLSETRYRCKATGLQDGTNQIVIQIQEPGCPISEYPFEVTYTKPVPKSVSKPAVKEKVVIQNKTKPRKPAPPKPVKQPKKPHLEI